MNEQTVEQTETTVGQKFQYEVEKESSNKGITFEYSEAAGERLRVEVTDGVPFIVANRPGMLALAKLLLKIGAGRRNPGFQLYLRQDFDSERETVLRIVLEEEAETKPGPDSSTTDVTQENATAAA